MTTWTRSHLIDSRFSELRQNLFLNPAFEPAASGTLEVRRNHATDPAAAAITGIVSSGGLGWRETRGFGTGGAGTYTRRSSASDGPAPNIGTYSRKTWTTAPASVADSAGSGWEHGQGGTAGLAVIAGQTWTFSSWVRTTRAVNAAMDLVTYDAAGALVVPAGWSGSNANPPAGPELGVTAVSYALPVGGWVQMRLSILIPTGVAFVNVLSDRIGTTANGAQAWQVGDTFDGTALLAELTSVVRPYFDGGRTPTGDPDFTAAWAGTANNSVSILSARLLTYPPNGNGVRCRAFASTASPDGGDSAMRVVPTDTSITGSYVGWGSASAFGAGTRAGRTFVVAGTISQLAPLTGALGPYRGQIGVAISRDGASYDAALAVYSDVAPNTGGITRVFLVVAVPADATGVNVSLYHQGLVGSGDVWWDDVTVEDITGQPVPLTPPGPLDGGARWARWLGTANNSVSVGYRWANP